MPFFFGLGEGGGGLGILNYFKEEISVCNSRNLMRLALSVKLENTQNFTKETASFGI